MTAGSVAAPQIIPIRMPPPGKAKHEIDSCTAVEIKSESSDVSVLYTLDGSKPEMMKRPGFGDRTLKYTEAIRLPVGKVSVRAMAVSTDGRQSAVVTKVFIVAPSPSDEQDLTPGHEDDNLMNGRPINGKDVSFEPILNRSADGESLLKNLTSTQISRVQRETDFLRCPKCLSHRPSDPFARFCLHCGAPVPPIPGQRLPPTEGGQMGLCVHCKTMVPLNTATCVVCESPLTQQLQPQASLRLQDKLICHSCGTGNPAHITHCVTCESQLLQQTTPVLSGQRAAPVPSSQGKMVSCSKCNRVNHSDARFCDWCGAKPGHKASSVTCSQCGASSHPYANYCGGCGVFLDGPPRTPSHVNQGQDAQESSATWQAVPAPESTTVPPAAGLRMCADAQTQTVGLFFPSSSELKKRSQQREAELSRQEQMSDRKPLLTAVSPGRGYWRKQLDHICAHLRSYTQNNTEFRALIGEPRLGRVRPLSRALKIIIVNIFILLYIISYIIIYYYKETFQKDAVQQLLDEGADPACLGSDGRPALVAAALNGHHDVIPVLVQREADVNQASGPLNNTALHEAAALGNQGLRSVEILLGCNASIRKQNNRGQTAYDIAVAAGSSSAVSLMAAHMGQELLQHHTKLSIDH
uniref:Double zinc ribbon and ankyrin repeat-containing protein 1 n=1 Tax=Sinocyclocheilus anshuiensis TaxID=1608454 RepID=A0A671MTB8_9TELE